MLVVVLISIPILSSFTNTLCPSSSTSYRDLQRAQAKRPDEASIWCHACGHQNTKRDLVCAMCPCNLRSENSFECAEMAASIASRTLLSDGPIDEADHQFCALDQKMPREKAADFYRSKTLPSISSPREDTVQLLRSRSLPCNNTTTFHRHQSMSGLSPRLPGIPEETQHTAGWDVRNREDKLSLSDVLESIADVTREPNTAKEEPIISIKIGRVHMKDVREVDILRLVAQKVAEEAEEAGAAESEIAALRAQVVQYQEQLKAADVNTTNLNKQIAELEAGMQHAVLNATFCKWLFASRQTRHTVKHECNEQIVVTEDMAAVPTDKNPMFARTYSNLCADEAGVPLDVMKEVLSKEGRDEAIKPYVLSTAKEIWSARGSIGEDSPYLILDSPVSSPVHSPQSAGFMRRRNMSPAA